VSKPILEIADLERLARRRVPRMFFDYDDSGAFSESTYRANERDFEAIRLRQRVAKDIADRSLASTMAGQPVALPVGLAPAGAAGMQHADGEILAARAASRFGVPYTLATMSISSIEDVAAAAGGPFWFQLYVMRDRGLRRRSRRARPGGRLLGATAAADARCRAANGGSAELVPRDAGHPSPAAGEPRRPHQASGRPDLDGGLGRLPVRSTPYLGGHRLDCRAVANCRTFILSCRPRLRG
jgi:hypothetical protein